MHAVLDPGGVAGARRTCCEGGFVRRNTHVRTRSNAPHCILLVAAPPRLVARETERVLELGLVGHRYRRGGKVDPVATTTKTTTLALGPSSGGGGGRGVKLDLDTRLKPVPRPARVYLCWSAGTRRQQEQGNRGSVRPRLAMSRCPLQTTTGTARSAMAPQAPHTSTSRLRLRLCQLQLRATTTNASQT